MFDALTGLYTFACPRRGESRVALSAFRSLEPLAGTAHPAVYRVRFACPCGDEHDGLVRHDELDWAPLGLDGGVFLNLMTSRIEPVAAELAELAAVRIRAGEWPWSFFCYPEELPRPVFPSRSSCSPRATPRSGWPSAARPAAGRRSTSSRTSTSTCPSTTTARWASWSTCSRTTPIATVEEFRAELWSTRFDARRLEL